MLREIFSAPPVKNLPRHTPTKKKETSVAIDKLLVNNNNNTVSAIRFNNNEHEQQIKQPKVINNNEVPYYARPTRSFLNSLQTTTTNNNTTTTYPAAIIKRNTKKSRFSAVGGYHHPSSSSVRSNQFISAGLSHDQANVLLRGENRSRIVFKPAKHSRFSTVGTYKNVKYHGNAGLSHDEMIRSLELPNLKVISAIPANRVGTSKRFEYGSHFISTNGADVLYNPPSTTSLENTSMVTIPKADNYWLKDLWMTNLPPNASIPDLGISQCNAMLNGPTMMAHPMDGKDLDGKGAIIMTQHKHSRFSSVGSYLLNDGR
jgi:hypothetical protein